LKENHIMRQHSVLMASIFSLIVAGPVLAADEPPAAMSTAEPAAAAAPAPAAPAPAPAAEPAAAPTPAAPAAAAAPAKPKLSACQRAINTAESRLTKSKAQPEIISEAWQHIQAAKAAQKSHKDKQCVLEAKAATKGL